MSLVNKLRTAMGNQLTPTNNEPDEFDVDMGDLDFQPEPEPEPQIPANRFRSSGSVLIDYDRAVEKQVSGLSMRQGELEQQIAILQQELFENKAAQSGLNLARSSWSNQLPKQSEDEETNADALRRELDKRRNGTEATPTGQSIPLENG